MKQTILIVEDDRNINQMLQKLLSYHGYDVVGAYSGTEALLLHNQNIDLILLDLMLPGKNGEEVIVELKKRKFVPIIVMSAIHEVDKKVNLFELGADDYITKPFDNKELLARIKVQMKTVKKDILNHFLKYKDIELDLNNYCGICNHQKLTLTKNEFLLLKTLMENPNQVHTKSSLFDTVWNDEHSADDNTLNVHISKIRNKLKECNSSIDYIETVWSIGYKMKS